MRLGMTIALGFFSLNFAVLGAAVSSWAQEGRLTDIARNADGSVRIMNQYDATKYCKSLGFRVPTMRELAIESQQFGAAIRETSFPGVFAKDSAVASEIELMEKEKFTPIYKGDSSSNEVLDFYLSIADYRHPTGDLGNFTLWSSSYDPEASFFAYQLPGLVQINSGEWSWFFEAPRAIHERGYQSVRCIDSP